MLGCYQQLAARPSYQDSLKILEADIHHANLLAASIPRGKGGSFIEMKLVFSELAPILMCLLQWMDFSSSCLFSTHFNFFHVTVHQVCSDGRSKISSSARKATVGEFYNVILPSLKRLHADSLNIDTARDQRHKTNLERDDECGICLEPRPKIVVPNCCHAMCINCYRDWNARSESCPFCRGSIKRVNSEDLWVLTCTSEVVDTRTALREDILRFYLFVNNLPEDIPDALFVIYNEYLF